MISLLLNTPISTDPPECACAPDNGGYIVHPVPAPCSTNAKLNSNNKAGGNNQKLILFNLGNAIIWGPYTVA